MASHCRGQGLILGQFLWYLWYLMLSPVNVIPPMLHTHSLIQLYVAYVVRYVHCSHVVMYM